MKILTRAKSLCYNEYLISDSVMYKHNNLYLKVKGKWRECDETTRSLNFEDMLDRQGNKIFASLSKDGKGGDILEWTIFPDDMPKLRINGVPYYSKGGAFKVTGRIEMMWHLLAPHKECKIIGIQE